MEESLSPNPSLAIEVNWFLLLLILCTCVIAHILHMFSSSFISWVVELLLPSPQPEQLKVEQEIATLRKEQNEINMVDDFPAHARLERRISKKQDRKNTIVREYNSTRRKWLAISNVAVFVVIEVFRVSVVVLNRQTPVAMLPSTYLWPLPSYVVSFPTGIQGAVGVPLWALACRQVIAKLSR